MSVEKLNFLWSKAITDLLGVEIDGGKLDILARQTYDSIRRIEIYAKYKKRATEAVKNQLPFSHTSNPFTLAQRSDLNLPNRIWILYLATYFGKSNKSKWKLFERAAYKNEELITFEDIQKNLNEYFKYLSSFDFFENCNYSNHRKFTKKELLGNKGFFRSIEYFVNNINSFINSDGLSFHEMYLISMKVPNFGRLAAFDFTSTLVKCGLPVKEPTSMYANHSTGPLEGLELMLKIAKKDHSRNSQIILSNDLMKWFFENSNIFMTGQVLEDAICNWQKNTNKYIKYTG